MAEMLRSLTPEDLIDFGKLEIKSIRIVRIHKLTRENHKGYSLKGYFYNNEDLEDYTELIRKKGCWWFNLPLPVIEVSSDYKSIIINPEDNYVPNLVNINAKSLKVDDVINFNICTNNKSQLYLVPQSDKLQQVDFSLVSTEGRNIDRYWNTFEHIGEPLEWLPSYTVNTKLIENVLSFHNSLFSKLYEICMKYINY